MRRNRKAINNCQGGDALAPPPVGDNLRRRRFGYGQRSLEERPCRHAVPLGRDVHVDDLPVLVDGARAATSASFRNIHAARRS